MDFPDDATFLSPLEKHVVIARLKKDGQASHRYETFKWKYFWAAYKDWKTYTGMVMYMGVDGSLYAFSLFLPSIISSLGYTATKAQLLTVPPYAVACLMVSLPPKRYSNVSLDSVNTRPVSWASPQIGLVEEVSSTSPSPSSAALVSQC